jgi:lantibiotic modifying enzyme
VRALIGCALAALFAFQAPGAAPLAPASTIRDRPHLVIAQDTARWLRASAMRTPHGLTWPPDPAAPVGAVDLYSGSAGVVLFFLELHHATGNPADLSTATAGADHLLAAIDDLREPGLYTGLAGLGFVLGEAARATGSAAYREGARRVVTRLAALAEPRGAGVEWNDTTDVIAGSAGIGLFLLDAARTLDVPAARELAARAGRRLLERGTPEAGGTSWPMDGRSTQRYPNFSHGTAGVAYFLATLYRETGDRAFLEAALAGARHLQGIARTEGDACLVFHHEPDAEGRRLYYLGWCHGPAGTARLWHRLWQITGDPSWREWTAKSARGLLASGIPERETPGFWNNAGQCCGSAGVAEFALAWHRTTGDAEALAFARRLSAQIAAKATRDAAGVRWVHAEHRTRPGDVAAQTGWMQGAAGLGAWFLHLDAFERGVAPPRALPDSPF